MTVGSEDASSSAQSSVLVVSLGATALAALPATFRLSANGGPTVLGFLAYWGSAALSVGALGLLVRIVTPLPAVWTSVPLAAALSVGPLALMAHRVKDATHHRPLGAVTFAFAALALTLGLLVMVRRTLQLAPIRRRAVTWILTSVATLSVMSALLPLLDGPLRAQGMAIDAGLLLGSTIATALVKEGWFPRLPPRGVWAVWAAIAAGGIIAGHVLGVGAWQNAPLLAGAFGGLGF